VSSRLQEKVEEILPRVSKPARYIGKEVHTLNPEGAAQGLRMVLSYPDVYEIGMSNLAVRILYETINRDERFSCERVFVPWMDFEQELRKNCIPLYSLETFTPLCEFDVIGFSMGYELLYTNVLTILELASISLAATERQDEEPIVIAGGPAIFNPEPMADFIDVFVIGDGEIAIIQILEELLKVKARPRKEKLISLNSFDFTYVPALYNQGTHRGFLITRVDKSVKKRIEPDLELLPFPRKPIIPLTRIVQDRITVEVNRGCASGCRYCAAGFIYRPVRERSVEGVFDIIQDSLTHSGYDEVALLSLSVGDYTGFHELVRRINERFASENVSISLPSLRVNSTNIDILRMVKEVRKSGLTFAIESADGLTRNRINKPVDIGQLKEIIGKVSQFGWRLIKLYFMVGLPMAEKEDERIAELVLDLLEASRSIQMNVNVSVFVPKPHTPFQFARQIDVEEAERIIGNLRDRFSRTRVHVKFQNPRMSLIEGILSRGDRRVARLIHEVHRLGERFSSWDDVFRYDLWEEALKRLNLNRELYNDYESNRGTPFTESGSRGIPFPEPVSRGTPLTGAETGGSASTQNLDTATFPWYFISSGIKGSFLKKESERAKKALLTGNCVHGQCAQCGVCQRGIKQTLFQSQSHRGEDPTEYEVSKKPAERSTRTRVKMLFQFKKQGLYRFISHLDLLTLFIHLGKMAGIPFSYSRGFNPKPHFGLPFPLPLGVESEYEIGEAYIEDALEESVFCDRYNSQLPVEMKLARAERSQLMKSVASFPFFHDYMFPYSHDIEDLLQKNIERGKIFDISPCEFYVVQKTLVMLRIGRDRSIKKLFGQDLFVRTHIQRRMLWQECDGKLVSFFKEK